MRYRLLSVRKACFGLLWVRVLVSGPGGSYVLCQLLRPGQLLTYATA